MTELILILEDENTKYHYNFCSSDDLENFLLTIDLKEYCHKNILFYIDDELNYEMSKIYKIRYLK